MAQKRMRINWKLEGKFAAWLKLKNKTGNVYDPLTNTFNLSEEEWQIEMKCNKYVEALRSVLLAYPELCCQLYEGSTSNGFASWGPSSMLPHPSKEVYEHKLDDMDVVDVECTQMDSPDKYYLRDAAYTNTRGFMTPYRGTRPLTDSALTGSAITAP
ncbi:unnamed protein product [Cuscuta campestris]|uniref:Myb/SANT-like domain-containing protein n=1 Tax=Cuscuta campestris TaxID=132261 RepID=A0A484L0N5_9ASTE|nr:unnamed protein product [Cuscuta campestris]